VSAEPRRPSGPRSRSSACRCRGIAGTGASHQSTVRVSKGSSNGHGHGHNEQQRRTFSLDRLHETPAGPGQREIRVAVVVENRAGQGDDRDSELLRNDRNAHTGFRRVLLPPHLFALGRVRHVMVGVRQHRPRLVHGALGCMGMGVGRWWRNEGLGTRAVYCRPPPTSLERDLGHHPSR
jgi:hypothetical protein